jgi:hypothetical protein
MGGAAPEALSLAKFIRRRSVVSGASYCLQKRSGASVDARRRVKLSRGQKIPFDAAPRLVERF